MYYLAFSEKFFYSNFNICEEGGHGAGEISQKARGAENATG
jgi:hypothetical protein